MSNLKLTIGIEIHLELLTKTKMFSSAPNTFGKAPNTQINEVDMGYPGILPTVNKQAVVFAITLAKALKMKIDNELSFDRKHYYYPDLPKGYQITQQTRPIGKIGVIPIHEKIIDIERIHLEEDTAKQIHKGEYTYLDFNRAGIPLIEVVTFPVIHSCQDAILYVKAIQSLARELGISDARMDKGSLRTDINISLSRDDSLGTKVEIKNMNSFHNIEKAINNEIKEQTKMINNKQKILMSTKRFDEKTQSNIVMREKTSAVDYKYLKEPNIIPILISQDFINSIALPILPWDRKAQYIKEGLNDKMIEQLMTREDLSNFYNSFEYKNRVLFAKILFSTILPLANKENKNIAQLNIPSKKLFESLLLLENNKITNSHIKTLIPLLIKNKSVEKLVLENEMFVISSEKELTKYINKIIKNEEKLISKNIDDKQKLKKILLGKLMKETSGYADIHTSIIIISKLIDKYN